LKQLQAEGSEVALQGNLLSQLDRSIAQNAVAPVPESAEVVPRRKHQRKRVTKTTEDMTPETRHQTTQRHMGECQVEQLLNTAVLAWRHFPEDFYGSMTGEFILPVEGHLQAGEQYSEPVGALPVHHEPQAVRLVSNSDRRANALGKA